MNEMMQERENKGMAMYSSWFVLVVAIFITSLITANITSVKLISL
jgi:hypothetical protein